MARSSAVMTLRRVERVVGLFGGDLMVRFCFPSKLGTMGLRIVNGSGSGSGSGFVSGCRSEGSMFSSGIALEICSWDGLCIGRSLGYGLEPDGVGVGLIEAVACELSLSNKALGTSYSGHPSFGPLPGPCN